MHKYLSNIISIQGNFALLTLSAPPGALVFMHACTNLLKILQGSSNFCKTQHVLYFLNAGGSRISNMTFPCVMKVIKIMKVMRISLHICISLHFPPSLHFSTFLCISLQCSAFLYTSLRFYAFLCIFLHFSSFLYISLHFSAFQVLYFRTI